MNKFTTLRLLSILCFSLVCSCTEKVDVDSNSVYVYAIIENSDVQTIILHQKAYASSNGYLPVEDANIEIEEVFEGDSNIYVFDEKGEGKWTANFKPKPQAEYKLTVTSPKFNKITASALYPDTLKFLSYTVTPSDESYNRISIPEIAKPIYKRDRCYIWMYYADYLPESKQWAVSDSTAVISSWQPWQSEYEGILPKVNNDAVVIASHYNPLQEQYLIYGRYKRYSGAGRCEAIGCIPLLAQYMSAGQKGVTLYGFEKTDTPYIHLTGRLYTSQQENIIATSELGLLHPESYIMLQSIDEAYDKYLKENYAINPKFDFNDTVNLSDYSEKYSNVKNATGIFGCTFKYKLFLKNCRGDNETPIWKLADADLR